MLRKIYVTLDSILDIRSGVLNTIDYNFCLAVTNNEEYFLRQEDKFGIGENILSVENYNKVLNDLPKYVLMNSFKTKMYKFINELRSTIVQLSITTPSEPVEEIDVNVYPFKLTENEYIILSDSISKTLGNTLKVNLVNISNSDLKLDVARNKYSNMILYNYHEWLNLYTEDIKKKPLRETNLYVPRLFFNTIPKEELDKLNGQDPFDVTQKILSPFINMEYLPIALYSVDIPSNKDNYIFTA